MNNEDRVICARERGETEGVAAAGRAGVMMVERNAAALKQVAAVLLAPMQTGGGHAFRQGYITHAA